MSKWEEKRLEDIIDVNPPVKLKKGEAYPFIDIDKVSPTRRSVTNEEVKVYDGQSSSKFCDGDTVFSRITPCLENRKIAKVAINGDAAFGSTEFYVFRAKKKKADARFTYYLTSSDAVVLPAINSMTGASGRQRADKRFIQRLKLNLPDLPTQERIADILSAYDDLIEANNRRIELLEQTAQELYKEWFVRFRFPGYENAKFENGLPERWELKKIGDIAHVKSGYAFKSEWWIDEGVPVVKIKDIQGNTIDFGDLSHVSEDHAEIAKQFYIVEGDLLIAMTGATIGKMALVPYSEKQMVVNQRVGKFFLGESPSEKAAFLYMTLQQNWVQELIVMIAGSNAAQPNISPFDIEKIKVVYNEDMVDEYNRRSAPFIEEILQLRKQNQNLATQRDMLLPRLISGKLEV